MLGCSQRGFNTIDEWGKGSQVGLTHLVQAPEALWGHLHPRGDPQQGCRGWAGLGGSPRSRSSKRQRELTVLHSPSATGEAGKWLGTCVLMALGCSGWIWGLQGISSLQPAPYPKGHPQ